MLDLLFKNINIVDGTGSSIFTGDVGVKSGAVTFKTDEDAVQTIDGTGKYICPGFIDFHSHGDGTYGTEIGSECKISQGITTEITGQCGSSMFPVIGEHSDELKRLMTLLCKDFPEEYDSFTSFERYSDYVDNIGLALNAKQLIGHGSLRIAVMGYQNRRCTEQEMDKMKAAVCEAMEHGAFGISSGLIYSPSCFADSEELIELCKVVAEYGGVYETHMRNESGGVVDGVKEALRVGKEAGIPVCISHHKVQGRPNWGLSTETLKLIDEAVAADQKVTLDQYPYLASMTSMNAIIPPAYFGDNLIGLTEKLKDPDIRAKVKSEILDPETDFENQYINCGGFDNILIAALPQTPEYDGMTISEAADAYGKDVFETLFDLLVRNECLGSCIYFSMCEEDMCRIFMNPNTVIGTDGIYTFRGQKAHPRAWGTFPHAICYFHKQKQLVSLQEMIRKITLLPAQRAMIENKGAIKEGWDADLVVFDYEKLEDKADFKNTDLKTEGIEYVIVNGEIVYHDKKLTGKRPGRLIRHNGR